MPGKNKSRQRSKCQEPGLGALGEQPEPVSLRMGNQVGVQETRTEKRQLSWGLATVVRRSDCGLNGSHWWVFSKAVTRRMREVFLRVEG